MAAEYNRSISAAAEDLAPRIFGRYETPFARTGKEYANAISPTTEGFGCPCSE